MDVAFPLRFGADGRTAPADPERHVRDLIEQVLFTSPGERVNRPDFGSGVTQLVLAPGGEELAAATELAVQGALERWLGDRVLVDAVRVSSRDGELTVAVEYTVRRTGSRHVAEMRRPGP